MPQPDDENGLQHNIVQLVYLDTVVKGRPRTYIAVIAPNGREKGLANLPLEKPLLAIAIGVESREGHQGRPLLEQD